MDYFSGFAWAVPKAFSDAIALCRFEEGDVLYDTKSAYEKEWDDAKSNIKYFLQVRYPGRARTAISGRNARYSCHFPHRQSAGCRSPSI